MQIIQIEKRIPFGFREHWGKLYKKTNYNESVNDVVQWNKTSYYDLGQDVQFKFADGTVDRQKFQTQPVENFVRKGEYRVVQTTDSYFDEETGQYECVVELGDIVFLHGRWYVVDSIDSQNIYNPKMQSFYFIALKRIEEEVIQTERG